MRLEGGGWQPAKPLAPSKEAPSKEHLARASAWRCNGSELRGEVGGSSVTIAGRFGGTHHPVHVVIMEKDEIITVDARLFFGCRHDQRAK